MPRECPWSSRARDTFGTDKVAAKVRQAAIPALDRPREPAPLEFRQRLLTRRGGCPAAVRPQRGPFGVLCVPEDSFEVPGKWNDVGPCLWIGQRRRADVQFHVLRDCAEAPRALAQQRSGKVEWKSGSEDPVSSRQHRIADAADTDDRISGLANGTVYAVRVPATNSAGDGPPAADSGCAFRNRPTHGILRCALPRGFLTCGIMAQEACRR